MVNINLATMVKMINRTEKEMHEAEQEELPESERVVYGGLPDATRAEVQMLQALQQNGESLTFYQGQIIVFPWAKHVLQVADGEGDGDVSAVLGTDCGHTCGPGGGTM